MRPRKMHAGRIQRDLRRKLLVPAIIEVQHGMSSESSSRAATSSDGISSIVRSLRAISRVRTPVSSMVVEAVLG